MSKKEIFFRIAERCLEMKEFFLYVSGRARSGERDFLQSCCASSSGCPSAEKIFVAFSSGDRDRFFTETYSKEERLSQMEKHLDVKGCLAEADHICEGNLHLLGRDVRLPQAGEWHRDPLEGCEWPRIFYKQVLRSKPSRTVDVKYIWEVNRHQYLIVLGKAYWLSGDERYADKVAEVISSWISDNPYHCGVNWTSALELAVRSISWIWAYFLCRGARKMDAAFHLKLLRSLYEHACHMAGHLSYYSSPYNHLIGEAAGLHLIGSLFSQLKQGEAWAHLGWSILEENVEKQFFDDGMCVEQATFYHHFTLGFYLQAIMFRQINSSSVSEAVCLVIEKALEASMHLTKPDGTLPAIGDIDNARSLYFRTGHSWDFRGFLSLGAAWLRRPDFKRRGNGFSEELLWLCDPPSLEGFESLEETLPRECSKALPASGYFVMRSGWEADSHYLCFDCGIMAAGLHESHVPSAAHGHADALSFVLSVFGEPMLVDGGFNTYFGALNWHRYFREEAAHNTIKIGKHRQAEYCGRLTWQAVMRPKLVQWRSPQGSESVCGRLDYDGTTSHRREIASVQSSFWVLSDELKSAGRSETARAYFHFDAAVTLELDRKKKQVLARKDNVGLLVQYFDGCGVSSCRGKDGLGPEAGWQSGGYGDKKPAWVLSFNISLDREVVFFPLVFLPWKGRCPVFSLAECMPCSEAEAPSRRFSFTLNRDRYEVSLQHKTPLSVRCDGVLLWQ